MMPRISLFYFIWMFPFTAAELCVTDNKTSKSFPPSLSFIWKCLSTESQPYQKLATSKFSVLEPAKTEHYLRMYDCDVLETKLAGQVIQAIFCRCLLKKLVFSSIL